jgi:maltooligosyltrehalose synthase
VKSGQVPLGKAWTDTFVCLPPDAPKIWKDPFTGESVSAKKKGECVGLFVAELLRAFPVALLLNGESSDDN